MIYYSNFIPDFADMYAASQIESLAEAGLSQAEIELKTAEIEEFNDVYKNPLIMAGVTFLEVFPVGLIVALVSALILRREPAKWPPAKPPSLYPPS